MRAKVRLGTANEIEKTPQLTCANTQSQINRMSSSPIRLPAGGFLWWWRGSELLQLGTTLATDGKMFKVPRFGPADRGLLCLHAGRAL